MNNFTFTGRFGKDPECRNTQNGKTLCSFTVGVRTSKKLQDGTYATYWVNCQAWEHQARYISQTAKKGSMFTGSGEMRTDSYTAADGSTKQFTYVLLNDGMVSVPVTPTQQNAQSAPSAPVVPTAQVPVAPVQNVADPLALGGAEDVQLPFEI